MKARMDLGKFLEEEIVVGHGVENASGGKDDAVGGAEGGDEDREGDDDFSSAAEDDADRRGGNRIARGSAGRAERDKVSDYRDDVETRERERAEQESARESFLGIDDFAGAVGAELPAFVGPKNGDHGESEV